MSDKSTATKRLSREEIEEFRREQHMERHIDGSPLEPWAVQQNRVLHTLCDSYLHSESGGKIATSDSAPALTERGFRLGAPEPLQTGEVHVAEAGLTTPQTDDSRERPAPSSVVSAGAETNWRDLAHEAFLQLEYLHQRERQHSSTEAMLIRMSEKLGLPLDQPKALPSATAATIKESLVAVRGDILQAWADRCGIDVTDERVQEANKVGWPHDYGLFEAGWNALARAMISRADSGTYPNKEQS